MTVRNVKVQNQMQKIILFRIIKKKKLKKSYNYYSRFAIFH